MKRLNKKSVIAGAVVGAVLGLTITALAYWTSTGTTTGSASVGSATQYTVHNDGTTGGPLYPGSGTETVSYTVTNTNPGHQQLASVVLVLDTDGSGNIKSGGTAVSGCKAADFSIVNNAANVTLPVDLAHNDTYSSTSTISLTNTPANQDPCQGSTPDYHLNAS